MLPFEIKDPETVTLVEDKETKDAPPDESKEVEGVPVAGKERESNLPTLAETFPIEELVRSSIPLVVSTPNT
jgi:hypothetical protein